MKILRFIISIPMRLFYLVSRHRAIPLMLLAGSCFVLCQVLGLVSEFAESGRRKEFKISELIMADVGQGDGFMVRLWNGNSYIVDVGAFDEKFISAIRKPSIENFGKKESLHADLIFLSHDDADHAAALDGVVNEVGGNVGTIAVSAYRYDHVDALLQKHPDIRIAKIARHDSFRFGNGNVINIAYPQLIPKNETGDKPRRSANDDSVVMRASIGSTSILFTGDASEIVERALIQLENRHEMAILRSDILKVGHHGSKTSTGEGFIKAVNPNIALISVGKNNSYRHPAVDTLRRLKQDGRAIIRTDACGTYRIMIFEDGALGRKPCVVPEPDPAKPKKKKRSQHAGLTARAEP